MDPFHPVAGHRIRELHDIEQQELAMLDKGDDNLGTPGPDRRNIRIEIAAPTAGPILLARAQRRTDCAGHPGADTTVI